MGKQNAKDFQAFGSCMVPMTPRSQKKSKMIKKLMADGASAAGLKLTHFVTEFLIATPMKFSKAMTLELPDLEMMIDKVKDDLLAKKHAQMAQMDDLFLTATQIESECEDAQMDDLCVGATQIDSECEDDTQDPFAAADAASQANTLVLETAIMSSAPMTAATAAGPAVTAAGHAVASEECATAAENEEHKPKTDADLKRRLVKNRKSFQ